MLPIFFLSYSTLFKLKKKATNTRIKFALNKTISFVYSWQKNTHFSKRILNLFFEDQASDFPFFFDPIYVEEKSHEYTNKIRFE
ncbi:hypothetical protein EGI32_11330 [Ferruginibacter sp. HRS2-29]|nr:hypothetical protein [Ferruginibacter sp. HRS2-29]